MAGSVNKVILIGNLGRDPDVRTMQNGNKVATLSLATSESWRDKITGDRKEKTEWHRIVIFGSLADIAEKYLARGSKVYVSGKLETRKWQNKDGADQYTTEVVLRGYGDELTMLDGKGSGGPPSHPGPGDDGPPIAGKKNPDADMNDEIPW